MNNVTLTARLATAAPELRNTPGGTPVATLRLAVQRPRKNGEDQGADFVDVVVFGRQAETCAQYLGKGRKVAVSGRLSHSEWTAPDGTRRQKLEVIANSVEFLDRPADASEPAEVTHDEDIPF
ncbi:MAG: single-stranded DNA-binding protein [Solirubrobacteraceae bacterium]